VKAASEAGAKHILPTAFPETMLTAVFLPFLEEQFPALVDNYKKACEPRISAKGYAHRLSQLMTALRRKYGIGMEYARRSERHMLGKRRISNWTCSERSGLVALS